MTEVLPKGIQNNGPECFSCSKDHHIPLSQLASKLNKCEINSSSPSNGESVHPGLAGLDIQRVDGINYFKYGQGNTYLEQRERVRNVELRDDDVISVGFPRSGNHWTFEVVNMILRQNLEFENDQFYSRLLEFQGETIYENLRELQSPRVLTSHYQLQEIPAEAVRKHTKIIYILRNPKDVLVSLFNFTKSLSYEKSRFRGTWDEFLELQFAGEFPWGPWYDHVKAADTLISQHPECNVHIVHFEKLKSDPVAEIQKLCVFLGRSGDLAEAIARRTEFSNMKSVLSKGKLAIQARRHFTNGPDSVLRRGSSGDWRDWFTPAQSEAFDKLFAANMEGSPLGDLVRPYI